MKDLIINNKLFFRLTTSEAISTFGDAIFYIALTVLATNTNFVKIAVLIVAISAIIPNLLSFYFGPLADKISNKINLTLTLLIIRAILAVLIVPISTSENYKTSLLIFILIIVLNTIIDSLGNLSDALYTPIVSKIIDPNNMEQLSGLSIGVNKSVQIVAHFLGAIILIQIGFAGMAILNAATFLLAFLILSIKRSSYLDKDSTDKESDYTINENPTSILGLLSNSLNILKTNKMLLSTVITFIFVNMMSNPLTSITLLNIKINNVWIISIPMMIALVNITEVIGMLIGSFLGPKILKSTDMITTGILLSISLIASQFFMTIKIPTLFLLLNALSGFFLGSIVPKFSANIIKHTPQENLATIASSLNGILFLAGSSSTLLMNLLAQIIKINHLNIVMIFVMFILLILILHYKTKTISYTKGS